jgi:class 3 adenylate cyclase
MNIKRISIVTLIFALLMAIVAVVAAQDGDTDANGRYRKPHHKNPAGEAIMSSLVEDTGLEPEAVREALSDHETTLAELIIANGGNVDTSIADAVVTGTEVVNQGVADGDIPQERADEIISNMSDRVSEMVNNPRPERGDRPERRKNPAGEAIMSSLVEDTGLDPEAVREALSDHTTTLAELIIANGGNVDTSIADAVSAGTEVVNQGVANGDIPQERADEIISNMSDRVSEMVNNPRPERGDRPERRKNPAGEAIMSSLIDDTGLDPEAVREALRNDS